ncbi:rCG38772 [Rattus norvegicus]|uniref:RCG38772 n=1 Tax=Rattus norvegicus TaxID=10116 RepID=A6KA16_RAT|nr:rCG38772 [Rattus norvegicus]
MLQLLIHTAENTVCQGVAAWQVCRPLVISP